MLEPVDPQDSKDIWADAPDPAIVAQDAVFGEMTEEGPNYRDVRTLSPMLSYF